MTKMNNAGESSNDCEDGHSDVTQKTTNTRQDQTPVTNCIMGGSTGENQADIGQDNTSVNGKPSTGKGDLINGDSPAKNLEVNTMENQVDISQKVTSVDRNPSTEEGDPIDGVSPAKDLEVITMTVENVTNTRQDQTPVTDSVMGGSTEENQPHIGRDNSSVVGNPLTEKGDPIDGLSPAKDLELIPMTVENVENTRQDQTSVNNSIMGGST